MYVNDSPRYEVGEGARAVQIGELAARTGASRRAIGSYEQQGLLKAERTALRGWRVYGENAVNRVLNVRALISAGLTVDDIRHVAPCLDMKTQEFMACRDIPDGVLAANE